MTSKYDRWDEFFAQLEGDEHVWGFDEIEARTGVRLPPVARREASWWSNTTYWGAKWAKHGWHASARIREGVVRFGRQPARRGRPSASPTPGSLREKRATVAEPRSERIVLVGCVSTKSDSPTVAKDLYKSDYWDKRRAHAEAAGRPWFILSAKHGLLHPDEVIEPYDVSLEGSSAAESRAWADRVGPRLVELCRAFGVSTVEVHAGEAYTPTRLRRILEGAGISIDRPLEGMRIGEQKAWYLEHLLGSSDDPAPAPPVDPPAAPEDVRRPVDREVVVERLLEFGEESGTPPPEAAVFVPQNVEAERFLRENAFAFLAAVIFDQGIVAERAWEAPWLLRERLGHLDLERLAGEVDAIKAAVAGPPALHRYVNNVPMWVAAAAGRVLRVYGGDAAVIWSDEPSAEELQRRLEEFEGIGPKKGAMAVEILIKNFGVEVRDLYGTNLAYDVHVRRVFLRTGLADYDDQAHMLEQARRLNPERPGALDAPAWAIGRGWCHPRNPNCDACVLGDVCPRLIERGDRVKGA